VLQYIKSPSRSAVCHSSSRATVYQSPSSVTVHRSLSRAVAYCNRSRPAVYQGPSIAKKNQCNKFRLSGVNLKTVRIFIYFTVALWL
jgi:hypothetical protein